MLKVEKIQNQYKITIEPSMLDKLISFRNIIRKELRKIDNQINLDFFNEGVISTVEKDEVEKIILEYLNKEVSNSVILLIKGNASIDSLFNHFGDFIPFGEICEYIEELELRGLILDFNSVSFEKDIVGLDAGDRIKFISKQKYDFELELSEFLTVLKNKANKPEISNYIDNYINAEIIQKENLSSGDKEFYLHVVDYLLSDYFKNEYISYDSLDGMSFDVVKRNVHKWSQSFSRLGIKDDIENSKIVYQVDSYYWVQLISDKALDYESSQMGHCVGQGGYDEGVNSGKIFIYSLRDSKNEPHCTIEIRNGKINQIKGKKNTSIIEKYRKSVVSFIVNYLNIPLPELNDSLLAFCLLTKKDKEIIPSAFIDVNHIKHFFIGKSKDGIEDVVNQLVLVEADLFKYNVDSVKERVLKSINNHLVVDEELGFLIDKNEKELISRFINRNADVFAIDYQPLLSLSKIYSASKYRQWAIEYLKPLLLKKKFESKSEIILNFVDDFVTTFFNITLPDYLEEINIGGTNLNIYQEKKVNHLEEYVYDDIVKKINLVNNFNSLSNLKSDISVDDSLGCEDCSNEETVKELLNYKENGESLENDINEKIDIYNKMISELEDKSKEIESLVDEVVSDLSYYIGEYFKDKDLTKLELNVHNTISKNNTITNWENVDIKHYYSSKKMGDIYNIMSEIEKQIEQIPDIERDFDRCLSNLDTSCPCTKHSRKSSQFYMPSVKFEDEFSKAKELLDYLDDFNKSVSHPKLKQNIIELFCLNNVKILFSE